MMSIWTTSGLTLLCIAAAIIGGICAARTRDGSGSGDDNPNNARTVFLCLAWVGGSFAAIFACATFILFGMSVTPRSEAGWLDRVPEVAEVEALEEELKTIKEELAGLDRSDPSDAGRIAELESAVTDLETRISDSQEALRLLGESMLIAVEAEHEANPHLEAMRAAVERLKK